MVKQKKSEATKGSKDSKSENYFARDLDPEIESRVDALMTGEPAPKSGFKSDAKKIEAAPIDTAEGAPLLPSDKIPLLNKQAAKAEVKPIADEPEPSQPEPTIRTLPPEPISTQTEALDNEIDPVKAALSTESPEPDELGLESPETSQAVDEILAEESDTLLDVQDEVLPEETPTLPVAKESLGAKIKSFFKAWWQTPRYRWATVGIVVAAIAVTGTIPSSRYFVLNTVGVRSSMSLTVLDQKTTQPLKNVDVSISGQSAKTDKDGKVTLRKIKLGSQNLSVNKPAFAEVSKKVTIGWGSNPFGEQKLTPVGSQYTFMLKDFLSDKPVTKNVEATSGIASAVANEKGEVVLTVPESGKSEIEITITAEDYRTENLRLPVSTKDSQTLKMVTASKHVFVSKRAGVLDVYSIDLDGKNEEKVFAGSGKENPDTMALVPHPSKNMAALVSVRGQAKNKDNFLLSSLTLINVDDKKTTNITDSERVQIIDWIGDKLVYVKIAEGESAASPNRHRLLSYDAQSGESKELASTNYFNDVLVANGVIYYSPAEYQVKGTVGLFRINSDGTNKKTVFDKEVWNMFRTDYDKISLAVAQDWYEYSLSSDKVTKANGAPATQRSRIYSESPDKNRSLWVDERDGKGVLLSYDHGSKEDKTIQTQSGLKNPIYWLDNDHAVYRVSTGQEVADYVVSLSGGSPLKIKDVTDIAGVDRWYYY